MSVKVPGVVWLYGCAAVTVAVVAYFGWGKVKEVASAAGEAVAEGWSGWSEFIGTPGGALADWIGSLEDAEEARWFKYVEAAGARKYGSGWRINSNEYYTARQFYPGYLESQNQAKLSQLRLQYGVTMAYEILVASAVDAVMTRRRKA